MCNDDDVGRLVYSQVSMKCTVCEMDIVKCVCGAKHKTRNVKFRTKFKIHTISGGTFRLESERGYLQQMVNDENRSDSFHNFNANQQVSNFKNKLIFVQCILSTLTKMRRRK